MGGLRVGGEAMMRSLPLPRVISQVNQQSHFDDLLQHTAGSQKSLLNELKNKYAEILQFGHLENYITPSCFKIPKCVQSRNVPSPITGDCSLYIYIY